MNSKLHEKIKNHFEFSLFLQIDAIKSFKKSSEKGIFTISRANMQKARKKIALLRYTRCQGEKILYCDKKVDFLKA